MSAVKHYLWNRHLKQVSLTIFILMVILAVLIVVSIVFKSSSVEYSKEGSETPGATHTSRVVVALDINAYDAKLDFLAHIVPATTTATSSGATTTVKRKWPVYTTRPNYGAIVPFQRIVAFYGNFYSTKMGILGENDATTTRAKLRAEVRRWNDADPTTPVIPAVDYIAVTAQDRPGFDGRYRARMPLSEVQKAVDFAHSVDGITILDIQVGLSDVQTEVPLLKKYLMMPDVHLAIDPEFSMKTGKKPGTVIGTEDAVDINFAANYLASLVREYHLPPKILVVHRFTNNMLTNYARITPLPEVEIIIDMDGWGTPEKKIGTYNRIVAAEPVQFTGFKLFYKNDLFAPSKRMLSTDEILALTPAPVFIQYQ